MICRIAALLVLLTASNAQAGLIFNLNDTGGAALGTQARAGFQEAANFWSSIFMDDITINLDIGFQTLDPGVLGSTESTEGTISFNGFRNAVIGDITSIDDLTFAAGLPAGPTFSMYINQTADNPNGSGSATPYVDNDDGNNNKTVRMTFANAKALGLLSGTFAATDASIVFSNAFNFDFDASNGITTGFFDFVGVAIHEIGHALGFISGVDILDLNSFPNNPGGPFNDDVFTFVTPLDFMRFSDASELAEADIDWTADSRPKYFSLDGGTTALLNNAWSLGQINGDGRQASHWKDNRGIGLMDPTLAPGELGLISLLDIRALDALGYDINFGVAAVPEPSTMVLTGIVILGAGGFKARND